MSGRPPIHGLSRTGVGNSWHRLMTRCYSTKIKSYKDYGGRGILPCDFIRATPINLQLLLGDRPVGMSIERIDNNGGYWCGHCAECLSQNHPKNVRWATTKEQNRNQRDLHYLEIDGVTRCVAEWAEISGISYRTILMRSNRGVTGDALFKKPTDANRYVTIGGVTKPAKDWSAQAGIKHDSFLGRMDRGITGEALLVPVKRP